MPRKKVRKVIPKPSRAGQMNGKVGQPPHVPTLQTRHQVETMAGLGMPHVQMAKILGMATQTLRKHYPDELDVGTHKANLKVAESLFKMATSGGPKAATAAIFWMKCRAGWRETVKHEHTGADGGPIQSIDLSNATDEQLAALKAVFGPIALASEDPESDPE